MLLAFDVPVAAQARDLAAELGVKIFTADIIYHVRLVLGWIMGHACVSPLYACCALVYP